MVSVESTNKKRPKLNRDDDDDDDSKEDEIDLSKGEDREQYVAIQEGINNSSQISTFLMFLIVSLF